ncbi:hypothetical protein EDB84DRAFT_1481771 [Lactarius hengduanensis]|nr:hypothetical protein EDB84DRAFT_1481771 [Lactarius hengduanensis]
MTDYTTFPKGAHDSSSVFIDYARIIGRAYESQAMGLIDMCRSFSQVTPQYAHQDSDLRRVLRVCDIALRSAADSGTEVTDEANQRFKEAIQVLSRYSERWHQSRQHDPSSVDERMRLAKSQDETLRNQRLLISTNYWPVPPGTTSIDFVLLRSPLSPERGPETVTVRQAFTAVPRLSDILWNFIRLEGHARITLEQNPHFYSSLPTDESAYMPWFNFSPIKDFREQWRHLRTIYVLVDRPGRIFLQTKQINRSFGNVWMINDFLIFKDHRGSLEGEQLIRLSALPGNLWYWEQQTDPGPHTRSDHRCIRAIMTTTTPFATPASWKPFEDWTVLSHPASHSIHIHIYDAKRFRLPGATEDTMDLPPPPPASERPGYHVLYTTVESINDDILLGVFIYYRLIDEKGWNLRLGWRKLSHVCRRWRSLLYGSAFHLDMHILCTNSSPLVDTLSHLPSLPLVIDYHGETTTGTMGTIDELGMSQALQLRDRVRRVVLSIPSVSLHRLLVLMDGSYPILQHLCLSSTSQEVDAGLILPRTFMAPNLRYLNLLGISLPTKLPLLSSTVALVTLTLTNIQSSGYFLPKHLVTRLQFLPQLEELSICFSVPVPRPSAESELWNAPETLVTLPVLKRFTFRGVSAYLESLVAQISAPLLEHLGITTFNQVAFILPHLSHFINTTDGLKLSIASVIFERDAVSVVADQRDRHQWADGPPSFSFRVLCREFDWQVDCAAQICNTLMPALSGVEGLTLEFDGQRNSTEWQDGAVDGATWRELLEPFIGARELRICHALVWDLSLALESVDAGLDPMLLPGLQELAPQLEEVHANNAFSAFVDARQIAGRPVRVSPPPVWSERDDPIGADLVLHPHSTTKSWFRAAVIDRIRSRLGQKKATSSTSRS